ncbi:MAG TPA: acetyl-CoA carboxylase biotin carboxylase subunit [Polyangiales bacterium]|nr:acetyl-CoA carboxylase biotin carboxylase subunit [Polyangiales bacterium]
MTKTIQKVLIANRGEIARRIMRTCRKMGIGTVAVYSDADHDMPFVAEADEAVRLGPAPSVESYLRIDRILEAAAATGADAIHPGYGFLAENAAFAEACRTAGVIFIGPTPEAIVAMGSKREAKALVHEAGVPVIPGYDGASQDPAVLAREALRIGFPVLLKASAGGGGKGMKLVRKESELPDAIASAAREGLSAFGDGTLLVEKYIDDPRHVEIQILGDSHGNLIHLNERECSIQRRHQKIIEETPSPALDSALRNEMGEAAVRCGKAIGYENAGTVEFILAPDRSFYFLEVNTRLQVEHPITECVTGLDLVEEQIRVAQGEPLRHSQEEVRMEGAALEVRLYAEDPASGFLPQSGSVVDWHLPEAEGLRVDSGVESGSEVGIYYDPMLAKIITSGETRTLALQRMRRALRSLSVQGVTTNRAFLLRVLDHPAYVAGEIDTHFIDRHLRDLLPDADDERAPWQAAVVSALAEQQQRNRDRVLLPEIPSGWRNNYHTPQWVEYSDGERDLRVEYRHHGDNRFTVWAGESEHEVRVISWEQPRLTWEENGHRQSARVIFDGDGAYVHGSDFSVGLLRKPRFPDKSLAVPPGGCIAPMPGKIIELRVAEGDTVEAGQVLLIMEAMKMEHSVTAPQSGTVAQVTVALGDQVDADALLIVVGES